MTLFLSSLAENLGNLFSHWHNFRSVGPELSTFKGRSGSFPCIGVSLNLEAVPPAFPEVPHENAGFVPCVIDGRGFYLCSNPATKPHAPCHRTKRRLYARWDEPPSCNRRFARSKARCRVSHHHASHRPHEPPRKYIPYENASAYRPHLDHSSHRLVAFLPPAPSRRVWQYCPRHSAASCRFLE